MAPVLIAAALIFCSDNHWPWPTAKAISQYSRLQMFPSHKDLMAAVADEVRYQLRQTSDRQPRYTGP